MAKPPLSEALILALADAHQARTGAWPTSGSGPVAGSPGETWHALDGALQHGCRGLPGGDSLARLLRRARGLPERRGRPCCLAPARLRRALELRGQGVTLTEIGRCLGVSRQAVYHLLRRAERGASAGEG
jgi:hypothetical protein